MRSAQSKDVSLTISLLSNLAVPVCRYEGQAGSNIRNQVGQLTGVGIVQGLCCNSTPSTVSLRFDNVLQHWMAHHMLQGLCLVIPCPCEKEEECRKKLFVSIDQLIHHIQHKKGNHLGWVRFTMNVNRDRDVSFDDIRRAIALRVLPEWLRFVLKTGDNFEVPRCFTPSVYGDLF